MGKNMKTKGLDLGKMPTERISQRVLYVLVGIAAVVFALFFLVGYDMPFDENPDFNAPLFTDVLIGLMVVMLLLSLAAVVGVVVRRYMMRMEQQNAVQNGVQARRIARVTWISTFVLLVFCFAIGSSDPMPVNGSDYTDWLWLKVSDMFVSVAIVMLVAAGVAALFGMTRYVRKERRLQ